MKISSERKRLEEKNKKDEAKVMSLVQEVVEERNRHEELQREHNRVLMQQVGAAVAVRVCIIFTSVMTFHK